MPQRKHWFVANEFDTGRFEAVHDVDMCTWELVDLHRHRPITGWTDLDMFYGLPSPHMWAALRCERAISLYMGRILS